MASGEFSIVDTAAQSFKVSLIDLYQVSHIQAFLYCCFEDAPPEVQISDTSCTLRSARPTFNQAVSADLHTALTMDHKPALKLMGVHHLSDTLSKAIW